MEELRERIAIKESGQAKTVSKQRAMLKALTAKAVQGDTRAANVLLGIVLKQLSDEQNPTGEKDMNVTDQAVLEEFTNHILKSKKGGSKVKVNGRGNNND